MANFTAPNTEQLAARIQARLDAALRAVKAEAWQFGEEVMADSKENYVPVDLAELKKSGQVQTQGEILFRVILGYGNEAVGYALAVHENLNMSPAGTVIRDRLGGGFHARVGGPKYLERPFRAAAPKFASRIADAAQKAMKA